MIRRGWRGRWGGGFGGSKWGGSEEIEGLGRLGLGGEGGREQAEEGEPTMQGH